MKTANNAFTLASRGVRLTSGTRVNQQMAAQSYSQKAENNRTSSWRTDESSNDGSRTSSSNSDDTKTSKSRTGADVSDDGQVLTPHLEKTPSTRELFAKSGKEVEERLASEKKNK